ncbi:MAG: sulfite reductase subunit alpha [Alphaproteobacteria bacterium]|nr:sulfite reductase subunit alpha [Alphaproteobacteria bacterium]MBU2378941.1 sulfite reductase subunit alpha [Alphaproteobacteria bacterium]
MSADPVRWVWAALTVALWIAGTVWIAWRARRGPAAQPVAGETLIVVASQTGFGDELAEMTRAAVAESGLATRIATFADVGVDDLQSAGRVLFIASTTGEGDAPDSAAGFVRKSMRDDLDLAGVRYGLLALGDRTYQDFCGFGRALDGWLADGGATALFDRIEVDGGDALALEHWREALARLTGSAAAADWSLPAYSSWRLVERRLMNPGSPGEGAWRLAFEPDGHAPSWVAGDIAEIGIPTADGELTHREYSVASLPSDGRAEFLVRLMRRPDGTPGLGSGWLTEGMAVGAMASMRIRTNRAFHGPTPETPMILIGNGTGIAGLRAHLKARAACAAAGPAWLLFGERTQGCDSFYDEDLRAWLADGILTRLDRTFSRDPGDGRYVQALIAAAAEEVAAWVADGASVYVCGSLEGMAGGVQSALEAVLGAEVCQALVEAGRYRRDVY